jgi:hypothetical protein
VLYKTEGHAVSQAWERVIDTVSCVYMYSVYICAVCQMLHGNVSSARKDKKKMTADAVFTAPKI